MKDASPSYTLRVDTPDGTMWCTIIEDDANNPVEIQIQIGKSGSSIAAWTNSTANLVSMLLKKGTHINEIMIAVSSITTDRIKQFGDGIQIRSGPEGLVYCLIKYQQQKWVESGRDKKYYMGHGPTY